MIEVNMGTLYVIGIGDGSYDNLTLKAINILNDVEIIYCDEKVYNSFINYFRKNKIIGNKYNETSSRCNNAIHSALKGKKVAILGSGDTGIYGIANIVLERTYLYEEQIEVKIIPGITYALSGAALLGSPLAQDFAVMTLSDNIADKSQLINKITTLAQTDFNIVFYSICNPTKQNLILAKNILLKYRSPKTIIGITTSLGTSDEEVIISNLIHLPLEKVNSFSTLFVGNSKTKVLNKERMVTPLY